MFVETNVTGMLNSRFVDFVGKNKKLQSRGVNRLMKFNLIKLAGLEISRKSIVTENLFVQAIYLILFNNR
ncbi:MAG: hypothetical protein ABIP06_05545 [Pyrinomonadaceae bacterium]